MFHGTTHAMAARACCIDYDRELAIAAEVDRNGERGLIGVSRLVAEPDHDTADFAILIADRWQGCGLGMVLTRHCLKAAEQPEECGDGDQCPGHGRVSCLSPRMAGAGC